MDSIPVNNWSRKTVQLYSKSIMQKGMSADLARCVCSCLQLRNTSQGKPILIMDSDKFVSIE